MLGPRLQRPSEDVDLSRNASGRDYTTIQLVRQPSFYPGLTRGNLSLRYLEPYSWVSRGSSLYDKRFLSLILCKHERVAGVLWLQIKRILHYAKSLLLPCMIAKLHWLKSVRIITIHQRRRTDEWLPPVDVSNAFKVLLFGEYNTLRGNHRQLQISIWMNKQLYCEITPHKEQHIRGSARTIINWFTKSVDTCYLISLCIHNFITFSSTNHCSIWVLDS